MRGCLAPAVLEMAFLWSERQAKAVWQPGAGNRPVTRLAATRGAHCSSSHTASVDHSSQPAASWHPQSPYVLMPGSRQSPSSSAGEPLGVPPSRRAGRLCLSPHPAAGAHTARPPPSAATSLLVGGREASAGSLQLLLFLLLLDDTIFVSPVLSQLHQHPNCAQLPFMAGMCRQVQVSQTSVKPFCWKRGKMAQKPQPSPDGCNHAGLFTSHF